MGAHGISFVGAVFGESESSAHWNIRRIHRTSLPKQSPVSIERMMQVASKNSFLMMLTGYCFGKLVRWVRRIFQCADVSLSPKTAPAKDIP